MTDDIAHLSSMPNVVQLNPMLDLVGLVANSSVKLRHCKTGVKVIKEVKTNRELPIDIAPVLVGLLWVDLPKDAIQSELMNLAESQCSPELRTYLYNLGLNTSYFLYGTATAYIPRTLLMDIEKGKVTPYQMLTGGIYASRESKTKLELVSWGKEAGTDKFVVCPVFCSAILQKYLPKDRAVVLNSLEQTTMQDLIKNKRIFDIDNLVCCGAPVGTLIPKTIKTCISTSVLLGTDGCIMQRVAYKVATQQDPQLQFNLSSVTQPTVKQVALKRIGGYNAIEQTAGSSEFVENTVLTDYLEELLKSSTSKIEEKQSELDTVTTPFSDTLMNAVAKKLSIYYKKKPENNRGLTGRVILKKVFKRAEECGLITTRCKEQLISDTEYTQSILDYWSGVAAVPKEATAGLKNVSDMFMLILCTLLEIKQNIVSSNFGNADIVTVCKTNPYNLVYFNNHVAILDLDKLAMFFGVFKQEDFKPRCVAYMHSLLTDADNTLINSRTCIPHQDLLRGIKYGFAVTQAYNDLIVASGYAVNLNIIENLNYYFPHIEKDSFRLKSGNKSRFSNNVVYDLGCSTAVALETYLNSGLGILCNFNNLEYVCDYTLLQAEMAIYKKCKSIYDYHLKSKDMLKSTEEIMAGVSRFEALKGVNAEGKPFKLETEQVNAPQLLKHGIFALIGRAGCGKTTTVETIMHVLKDVYDIDIDDILLLAPTGRAASRMFELTKSRAYTIHSALGIGRQEQATNAIEKKQAKLLDKKVVIIDECSMIAVDLMYRLLSQLKNDVVLIFVGDIAQLLAIGFGKPFALLLKYLPYTALTEIKRTASNSSISDFANGMLNMALPYSRIIPPNVSTFEKRADVICISDIEQNIASLVVTLCTYHLAANITQFNILREVGDRYPFIDEKGVKPDDIQIVTPIKKSSYKWGTIALNKAVRDLFNPYRNQPRIKAVKSKYNLEDAIEYRVGDRIINNVNHAKATRYDYDEANGVFIESQDTIGVMNGEIGKIEKIIDGCAFTLYSDRFLTERRKSAVHKEREKQVFIVASFQTFSEDLDELVSNYIIFTTEKVDVPDDPSAYYVLAEGVSEIDLAYALTAHKMQGSQAKIIIAPIFNIYGYSDFMCLNMLYTIVSRAQKALYLLGSVCGDDSAVAFSRKVTVIDKRYSVFDIY